MEVDFDPELAAQINKLVSETGWSANKLVADAMAGYVAELAATREMLKGRYDDLKNGKVKPVDGEAFFKSLRQLEDELLSKQ